jgi:hypothetical protein
VSLLDTLGFRGNGNGDSDRTMAELARRQAWQLDLMQENMSVLENTVREDAGWRRIGRDLEREFTRSGLDDLVEISRAMYISHPLIQRAVNITTYYTWGQGVEFSADDKVMDSVITPMLEDDGNQVELYSHQARLLTDVDQIVDGNTFVALFDGDPVRVRSIPTEEIRQIIRNPEDRNEVWFYERVWASESFSLATGLSTTEQNKAYYPDIGFRPQSQPETIGGVDVMWHSPVIHQKIGGLKHMSFGIPGTYAALDWARAYRKFLEDWHTIVSSLARFAWRASTDASKVDRLKSKMSTGISADSPVESNAPPPAGSVFVGTDADSFTPIPKTGAHTSAEDAKPSRLMVGAAMDLPDTILSGDADQGTLATAKSLDRPTELAMRSRQMMWSHWHQRVFGWAIQRALENGTLTGVPDDELSVQVKFPPILEHDVKETVSSIISAATLDGKTEAGTVPREELARVLMSSVGIEDVQSQIDKLDTEDRASVEQAVERLRKAAEGLSS